MVPKSLAGAFGGSALAGGRTIDPAQWASDQPVLGLVREAGYAWGSVHDVETGDLVSFMRRFPPQADDGHDGTQKSLAGKLIIQSTRDGAQTLQLCREARGAAASDDLAREPIEAGVLFAPAPGAAGRGLSLEMTPERVHYVEEDLVDLAGPIACPALQWYLPGGDAALIYLTQTWEVTGTVLGRPVRGFLFWEEAYMPPGGRLYVAKDPLHDVAYTTWYSWANHYADGTVEVGHFLFGQRDFHVGLVASSDGSVRAARRMDAIVTRDAEGYWHQGLTYDLDGEAWVCEPDPRGRMIGLGPIPNPQQEGRVRRAGDDRAVEAWMAWGESVPAHGESRIQ